MNIIIILLYNLAHNIYVYFCCNLKDPRYLFIVDLLLYMIKKTGDGGSVRSYGGDSPEDSMKVTRSIMILKPNGYQSQSESAPASPAAGSTPPLSPFSGKVLSLYI
jgi:hypothetical protein